MGSKGPLFLAVALRLAFPRAAIAAVTANESMTTSTRTSTSATTTLSAITNMSSYSLQNASTTTTAQTTSTTSTAISRVGQFACPAPQERNGVYSVLRNGVEAMLFLWEVVLLAKNSSNRLALPVRSELENSTVIGMKFVGAVFQGYQEGEKVMLIGEPGYVLKEDVAQGTSIKQLGVTALWGLRCFSGYAPEPRAGEFATCEALGVLSQPGSCVQDSGCNGASAVARGVSSVGTDCAKSLREGDACKATCAAGSTSMGSLTCSRGEMVGDSVCAGTGQDIQASMVSRIAGTLAVTFNATAQADELLEGFAAGLDIRTRLVKKIEFSPALGNKALKGGRHFSGNRFHVKYEVDIADEQLVAAMILKIDSLSQPNSSAQRRFEQLMLTNFAVEAIQIGSVIAARIIHSLVLIDNNGTTMSLPAHSQLGQNAPSSAAMSTALIISVVVGCVFALVVMLCIAQYCVLMRRKANA